MDPDVTGELARLAPTLARLPRWTRHMSDRQLRWLGRLAWTGVTLLFLGAAALFWRTVEMGTAAAVQHADIANLQSGLDNLQSLRKSQSTMEGDVKAINRSVDELTAWHRRVEATNEEENRRLDSRLHPVPAQRRR